MQIDHDQADDSDGNVEEENHAPVEVGNDKSTGDWSEHGSDQGWYRYKAHDLNEVGFGEGPDQGQSAYRNHQRSTHALEDAARDEQMNIVAESAQQRAQREE